MRRIAERKVVSVYVKSDRQEEQIKPLQYVLFVRRRTIECYSLYQFIRALPSN